MTDESYQNFNFHAKRFQIACSLGKQIQSLCSQKFLFIFFCPVLENRILDFQFIFSFSQIFLFLLTFY